MCKITARLVQGWLDTGGIFNIRCICPFLRKPNASMPRSDMTHYAFDAMLASLIYKKTTPSNMFHRRTRVLPLLQPHSRFCPDMDPDLEVAREYPILGLLFPDVGLTIVSLLPDRLPDWRFIPSWASLSRNPDHNSARLSLPPGLSGPSSGVEDRWLDGAVNMLFKVIGGLSEAFEDTRRRSGVRGARRELFGFIGCEDAPGRARPADSFCSVARYCQ